MCSKNRVFGDKDVAPGGLEENMASASEKKRVYMHHLEVSMRNHGNRKVVKLLEQLTELSKAQVMPGIRPSNQDELTRRRLRCRAGTNVSLTGHHGNPRCTFIWFCAIKEEA